jgi:hypothetical protein
MVTPVMESWRHGVFGGEEKHGENMVKTLEIGSLTLNNDDFSKWGFCQEKLGRDVKTNEEVET